MATTMTPEAKVKARAECKELTPQEQVAANEALAKRREAKAKVAMAKRVPGHGSDPAPAKKGVAK